MQNICIPKESTHRFVLGKKGDNNLLVIALNPNTAKANAHDSTTRNIEKIASDNGFDGWLLFNLSPVRDPKPENLLEDIDLELQQQNLKYFETFINDTDWNFQNCWLAWGNGVMGRNYLRQTAIDMLHLLKPKQINYYCIRRTQQQHPYHSAQRVLNSFFKNSDKIILEPFPAQAYRELILEYQWKQEVH